ncbi:hypothetical protein DMN91_006101 [Ooceraea biroi]|uniref:Fringe-like glycosyltransferase domain-containing protein n=1 Tax=Ooceraea biroi TaxID=2015173 RepID=A0A3L8DMP8_OOCBI|nr:hypothetical protein DMN91_006101 [Ooceraea biroi]
MRTKKLTNSLLLICVLLITNASADFLEPNDVVMVIFSQKEGYHAAHADYLRKGIYEQASALEKSSSISSVKTYFAVKTCAKYHADRIPIIKNSWAKHAINLGYFSDVADRNLREAYVVPNTTEGHCAKTYGILQEADKILTKNGFNWLVISDDDTIFSVARLLRLLTCYNPKHLVAIGERYGFRMWDNQFGYQYLTGGAGMVLSAPLVHEMVMSDACNCPSATTPDDMYLFGVCLSRLGVEPVHSPMFHQVFAYNFL